MSLVDEKNLNSAFISYFQVKIDPPFDIQQELMLSLVVKYISQPFFNELRTKQQLGYATFCLNYSFKGIYGLLFLIQSDKHSNEYCIHQTNLFLKEFSET